MNKKIYILLAFVLITLSGIGQTTYLNQVVLSNPSAKKQAGNLILHMDVDISSVNLSRQHMMVLTPVLNSVDGITKMELPALVINGKTRHKALSRAMNVGGERVFAKQPHAIVERTNGARQIIPYHITIPLEDWMRRAQWTIKEEVTACADCELGESSKLLSERLLPADFKPSYQLTYITPEAEPMKQRSEKHEARLTFKVGKADILPDFNNNAAELAKVDRVIREVQNDKDLTVTNLSIAGYASPEGSMKSNMELSQRRANAFADYLSTKYNMPKNQFNVTWHGEDWSGLKAAVEASNITDKQAILSIINTEPNLDARDSPLKKLSGGSTYKTLLDTYYPPLRRNEYTIAYVARPFDVNEAKTIITTRPQLLSLNEMFLVAQTYEKGSADFKNVFDVAARMFPNDAVANLNAATAELEAGDANTAFTRLERFKDIPEAWNNMGIALVLRKQYNEALVYFERAAARGVQEAKTNAEQLRLFIEDQK